MTERSFTPRKTLVEYFENDYEIFDNHLKDEGLIFVYPVGEINRDLYEKLSSYSSWRSKFDPLNFFTLLYSNLEIAYNEEYKDNYPDSVIENIKRLDLDVIQLGFFIYAMRFIIKEILQPLEIKPYTLEKKPISRPLQRFGLYLTWTYTQIIEDNDSESLPMDFKPVKNTLQSLQIALICHYNGISIPDRPTGAKIARKYHRNMKTSGDELYNDSCNIKSRANRTGDPGSLIKLENKINRIVGIMEYLNESGKTEAEKDLIQLRYHRKSYINEKSN